MESIMLALPLMVAGWGNVLLYWAMDTERVELPDGRIGRMGGLLKTSWPTILMMLVAVDALALAALFILPVLRQLDTVFVGVAYGGTVLVGEVTFWGLACGFSSVAARRMDIEG